MAWQKPPEAKSKDNLKTRSKYLQFESGGGGAGCREEELISLI